MDYKQKIDAHFNHVWAEYEAHLAGRGVLDERIRRLAVIAQCATMGEEEEAEDQIRQAFETNAASALEIPASVRGALSRDSIAAPPAPAPRVRGTSTVHGPTARRQRRRAVPQPLRPGRVKTRRSSASTRRRLFARACRATAIPARRAHLAPGAVVNPWARPCGSATRRRRPFRPVLLSFPTKVAPATRRTWLVLRPRATRRSPFAPTASGNGRTRQCARCARRLTLQLPLPMGTDPSPICAWEIWCTPSRAMRSDRFRSSGSAGHRSSITKSCA